MRKPTRAEIAQRAMSGEPLGIPVWVKRRGNDKAAAILQQWEFGVDEPGQELTITLGADGVPVAPRKRDMYPEDSPQARGMTPEEYALQSKDLNAQLALVDINAKQLKKAAKAARKQTLAVNTSTIRHRIDVGWTLLASITITAFSVLAMFNKLPW